ncbi:hypothetical protein [Azospirillum rugosum]|uniref:Uncharacterized protein n=1 Tax=Azospirillum rugosum TaxID=416170 RepID=A0ABS4STT5_9PROT|nr:hypothetical protein [Azospirillum rugosum]MBP2295948.1 hypothetical protein [Azospirillum rugosum]MDQ0531022.1 hypothetical protein [Azospirillum rugosum]
MPYIFAVLVGVASLAFALALAMRRLKTAEGRIANAVARKQTQVERLRRAARGTLQQARDLRDARRRKASIELACEDLEQRLKASNAMDRRVYVLDDRRTPADLGWVVTVANPDYAGRVNVDLDPDARERWKRGRRFLVWGLDEKKAREKTNARYPDHKGFTIRAVEPHLD